MRRTFIDQIGAMELDDTDDREPDDTLGDDAFEDDDELIDEDTGEDSPAGGDDIVG